MLQLIRERAQGWIAWVIVILITIPFALWGIQSYLDVGGEPVAATVNGVAIPERDLDRGVQDARIRLQEQLGAAYDMADVDDRRLRAEVLDGMIHEVLLLDVTRRLGLRVSDAEIQMQILSEPAFQKDGRFNRETYERVLQIQGMTPALFETRLRQQMTGTQLIRAVAGSELVTHAEAAAYQRLASQQRELAYARFPAADYVTDEPIDDAAITAYYNANTARFQIPEEVKLDYLILDASALAARSDISDEELRQRYEAEQSRFRQTERRQISHLLIRIPDGADDAAISQILAQINHVRERILAGESFEELAKQMSADPGSAAKGGSLGMVEKGVMVPEFDQVAFSLPAGELSEPVRTPFGYHLIRVSEIIPAAVQPFDQVREQLRTELAKQRADAQFYELGERLATLVYESSDSLEPAAETLGLEIQHSDWISRQAHDGILGQPKVLAAAFSDEVRVEGHNSDLIEPNPDALQAIVLRVSDHHPASTQPLDAVRDQIVTAIRTDRAKSAAAAAANALATTLREGADWSATLGAITSEAPGFVSRQASGIPAAILDTAFKLPLPANGVPSIGTAVLDQGDAAVVRLIAVKDGDVKPDSENDASVLEQLMARQVYAEMLADMARRAKIERKPIRIEETH